jgi:hypothetical protein
VTVAGLTPKDFRVIKHRGLVVDAAKEVFHNFLEGEQTPDEWMDDYITHPKLYALFLAIEALEKEEKS